LNNTDYIEVVISTPPNTKGPSYSLRIDGNGNVQYNGISNVRSMGLHTSKISPGDLNRLVTRFKEIYFLYLRSNYESTDKPSSQQQRVSVSLQLGDRHKRVEYTEGSMVPLSLKLLVKEIEKITNADQLSG
jgi:hypothetical protein